MQTNNLTDHLTAITEMISKMPIEDKINAVNFVRKKIHEVSPFRNEPVDLVLWIPNGTVHANDYNPNSVAPPEMQLLYLSIKEDGYTQPIVTMQDGEEVEVIDGFHRHRVGKEFEDIRSRVNCYLPIVHINEDRKDKADRMASTIRHNRARGKHSVTAMSEIVVEFKKRMWSDEKIAKHLGMDTDEVLRLSQISGLTEMFSDEGFSMAWEADFSEELDLPNVIVE